MRQKGMPHRERGKRTKHDDRRGKGILDWKSGGLKSKRGKYGQPLANDYTLNLKTTAQKDKINGGSSVVHDYTNRTYNRKFNTDTEQ